MSATVHIPEDLLYDLEKAAETTIDGIGKVSERLQPKDRRRGRTLEQLNLACCQTLLEIALENIACWRHEDRVNKEPNHA
jgi:hypothetical protein